MCPFYIYECTKCHRQVEELRHVEERMRPIPCGRCERAKMELRIAPVVGVVKNPAVPRRNK